MTLKSIEVLDRLSMNVTLLSEVYRSIGYDIGVESKTIFLRKKNSIPMMLDFYPIKQQLIFSIIIDVKNEVNELALARFVRKLNEKSFFCSFNYRHSPRKGNRLGATCSICAVEGVGFKSLVYIPDAFSAEFLKLCCDPSAKKVLYFRKNGLQLFTN